MMNLVIVESPTKARTIGKFLGSEYTIKASMGHIIDLPKSKIGVDVEHNFKPLLEVIPDKKKIISDLKSAAKSADSIILATDPDREGEAIAAHIVEILKGTTSITGTTGKKARGTRDTLDTRDTRFRRIVFHEITKEAIREALTHPRLIDEDLVNAQTGRRVLDRLVGYKLSPLLWQKVRRGLSAGRVQSIALRLIVEREREIEKFKKEKYYTINVLLKQTQSVIAIPSETREKQSQNDGIAADSSSPRNDNNQITEFELIEINGGKIEQQQTFNLYDGEYTVTKTTIDTEEQAKEIVSDLQTKQYKVSDVLQKETQRSPAPPYTTSTLQQSASRRLGFSGKRTMRAAQKLYEEGFITYHRTDSVVMAEVAKTSIRSFAVKEYGEKYVPEKLRFYAAKQKLAQEAHEAIRPTSFIELSNAKSQVSSVVGSDGWKLYELIWRRAVASQMSNAVIESTTVLVDASGRVHLPGVPQEQHHLEGGKDSYRLKANGSVLVFDGFLKVNPYALEDKRLPEFKAEERLNLQSVTDKEHETQQPPRYNDASLIKTLEEKGIGRPSTYAPIISTIEDRRYMERQENKFVPTSIGIAVNDFLVKNFSDIDDIPFTADMEDQLDDVASGEKNWVDMMSKFYKPFAKKLEEVKGAERVKIEVEQTDQKCEECGSPLVVRMGRFTKAFVEETNFTCPKDGGKIIIKKTHKGRKFFGCSNYPKCDFAAWKIEDIKSAAPVIAKDEILKQSH
ncbi:MAG: type I DNA topoisomerase [Candidatus Levybacteria bacterium]|nr:type I DNA topoisomerase [Candidatus Levybacteria bacterium]